MTVSNLLRHTAEMAMTHYKVYSKSDRMRGDIYRVYLHVKAGDGGFGFERRNGIGGRGGNVYLEGTQKTNYRKVEQVLDQYVKKIDVLHKAWPRTYGAALKDELMVSHKMKQNKIYLSAGKGENANMKRNSALCGQDIVLLL